MLNCFFSNRYLGRADLFDGLNIWNNEKYRQLQGTYPVIFLSFAGVKADNLQDSKTQIKTQIGGEAMRGGAKRSGATLEGMKQALEGKLYIGKKIKKIVYFREGSTGPV